MRRPRKPTKPPAFTPPATHRRPLDWSEEKPLTVAEAAANVERKYLYGGVIEEVDLVLDPFGVKVGWIEETRADREKRRWEEVIQLYEAMRRERGGDDGMASA